MAGPRIHIVMSAVIAECAACGKSWIGIIEERRETPFLECPGCGMMCGQVVLETNPREIAEAILERYGGDDA